MRQLLAASLLVAIVGSASAHQIWLVPEKDKEEPTGTALMVFSDTVKPDARVPVTKIAGTKLFSRSGKDGKVAGVKVVEIKDAYRVTPEGAQLILLGGSLTYGVSTKAAGGPTLLLFYPKTIIRKGKQTETVEWLFAGAPQLDLEIVPVPPENATPKAKMPEHRVVWKGKPAANVEVVLTPPGFDEPLTRKTDAAGRFELERPKGGGIYGMRATFVEPKAGEHDGKKYEQIRHVATFTFGINNWLVPPPPKVESKDEKK